MIRGCFRHCTGIGPKTAEVLCGCGFTSWDDCISKEDELPFKGKRRKRFIDEIRKSDGALDSHDLRYFTAAFPAAEQWRILNDYFSSAVFIDVETTGLSRYSCHVSVIAAYHRGNCIRSFMVRTWMIFCRLLIRLRSS